MLHYLMMYSFILYVGSYKNVLPNKRRQNNNLNLRLKCSSTSTLNERQKVVIIGGGFGGLYTALKLDSFKNDDVEIFLLDPKDKFVFSPLLYELAVGTASLTEVSPQYEDLVQGTSVQFIQSKVQNIDIEKRQISYTNEENQEDIKTLSYDQCVLATGNQQRFNMIIGAKEYAIPFYSVNDAYLLQTKLRQFIDGRNSSDSNTTTSSTSSSSSSSSPSSPSSSSSPVLSLTVIGGGYSGVEVATNIAKYLQSINEPYHITLIDRNDKIMHTSADHNREIAEKAIESFNIQLKLETSVTEIKENAVIISKTANTEGENGTINTMEIQSDITILTTGIEPTSFINNIQNLLKDSYGRLLVTPYLQCINHPNLFSLGDCASVQRYRNVPPENLPKTAQVAMQQADVVASNLHKRIQLYPIINQTATNEPFKIHTKISPPGELDSFRYIPLGEMLSLGNTDAAITSLGGLVKLSGPVASIARRVVYSARMPTNKQRVNAAVNAGIVTATSFLTEILKRSR